MTNEEREQQIEGLEIKLDVLSKEFDAAELAKDRFEAERLEHEYTCLQREIRLLKKQK